MGTVQRKHIAYTSDAYTTIHWSGVVATLSADADFAGEAWDSGDATYYWVIEHTYDLEPGEDILYNSVSLGVSGTGVHSTTIGLPTVGESSGLTSYVGVLPVSIYQLRYLQYPSYATYLFGAEIEVATVVSSGPTGWHIGDANITPNALFDVQCVVGKLSVTSTNSASLIDGIVIEIVPSDGWVTIADVRNTGISTVYGDLIITNLGATTPNKVLLDENGNLLTQSGSLVML